MRRHHTGRPLDSSGTVGCETRLSFKIEHLLSVTGEGVGVGVISIVEMILSTKHCSTKALRGDGGVSTSHGLKAARNLGLEALFSLALLSATALGSGSGPGLGGSSGPTEVWMGLVGGALGVDSDFWLGGASSVGVYSSNSNTLGLGGRLNADVGLSLGTGGFLVVIVVMFCKIALSVEAAGAFGSICQGLFAREFALRITGHRGGIVLVRWTASLRRVDTISVLRTSTSKCFDI